jgi:hypothetical protein
MTLYFGNYDFLKKLADKKLSDLDLKAYEVPWNIENFCVETRAGRVHVDDVPLFLYHFQGLQLFDNGTASLYIGDMRIRDVLRVNIYQPHLLALLRAFASIRGVDPAFASGLGKRRKYLGNVVKRAFKTLTKSGNVVPFQVT